MNEEGRTNMEYGVHTEVIGGRDVDTLTTGDGHTQFCNVIYDDGNMGLAFVYGVGSGEIGAETIFDPPRPLEELGPLFIVKFTRPDSIDSLIDQLEDIKTRLIANL